MGKFKYTGSYVRDLDSGQMLEPGEEVELSDEEAIAPLAETMINDGVLITVEEPKPAKASSRTKGEEGK